jgi:hypothetical protein
MMAFPSFPMAGSFAPSSQHILGWFLIHVSDRYQVVNSQRIPIDTDERKARKGTIWQNHQSVYPVLAIRDVRFHGEPSSVDLMNFVQVSG